MYRRTRGRGGGGRREGKETVEDASTRALEQEARNKEPETKRKNVFKNTKL